MKEKIIFREEPLIDREKERGFIKEWFEKTPKEMLWIYGPKSTGKTTIIEYIVENELFDDFKFLKSEKYNVKYINFRRKLFGNYESFINSMLFVDRNKISESLKMTINLGVFKVEYQDYEEVKAKRMDLFDLLFNQLKKSKKRNILIFDEIQSLEDIYLDKERLLLNEFLNFCVSLTKESHISHVILLSSNTLFINKIYNNAKLKVTSQFYKISHLKKETMFEWFREDFENEEELELVYEYLGGSIAHIQRLTRMLEMNRFDSLPEALEDMASMAESEIILKFRHLSDDEIEAFKQISKDIIENGYFNLRTNPNNDILNKVIDEFCEIEILFFEPSNNKVYANSKIYEKAMELLLK